MRVGVVSDTHGYLDPRALTALAGVEHILHAGDVGDRSIHTVLEAVAPVRAVRGNVDAGTKLGRSLPANLNAALGGVIVYMTHIGGQPADLLKALPTPRPQVYIFGHSHIASKLPIR